MLGERETHPVFTKSGIRFVVGMLQLAPAALGEMAARRLLAMGAGSDGAILGDRIARHREGDMAAACRHAVAARRDPDDGFAHSAASTAGIAATKSSAISDGPTSSAARP